MIADFRRSIEETPYLYRHLYWETGMVGQVLYLEAERMASGGQALVVSLTTRSIS